MDAGVILLVIAFVAMTLIARNKARSRWIDYKPTDRDASPEQTPDPTQTAPETGDTSPKPRRRAAYGAARARTKLNDPGE